MNILIKLKMWFLSSAVLTLAISTLLGQFAHASVYERKKKGIKVVFDELDLVKSSSHLIEADDAEVRRIEKIIDEGELSINLDEINNNSEKEVEKEFYADQLEPLKELDKGSVVKSQNSPEPQIEKVKATDENNQPAPQNTIKPNGEMDVATLKPIELENGEYTEKTQDKNNDDYKIEEIDIADFDEEKPAQNTLSKNKNISLDDFGIKNQTKPLNSVDGSAPLFQ